MKFRGIRLFTATGKKAVVEGVGIYISDQVKWKRKDNPRYENLECIWIGILVKKSKSFLVGILCQPPASSKYLPKDFQLYLNDMLLIVTSESKKVNLLGDLSVDYL